MRSSSICPGLHPYRDGGCLQEVAPVLGEDPADTGLAHPVPRPSHPLQTAGDAARRLHEEDEVHGPHVDPQLQ